MFKRILGAIFIIAFIAGTTYVIITYARGYRFNVDEKSLSSTGILSLSSYPDHSSIFLDGKLKAATYTSLNLSPNWYNVRISKDGYQSWEKRVRIQGEVVSQIDALLIPHNPSLKALTVTGILSPTLSPSGSKVAYIIPEEEATNSGSLTPKQGLWVVDLRTNALGARSDPRQIFASSVRYDWKFAKINWSPDEREIILVFEEEVNGRPTISSVFQIPVDSTNTPSTFIPVETMNTLFEEWKSIEATRSADRQTPLPPVLSNLLTTTTANIKFSPDETKILYLATRSATLTPVIVPPLIGSNPTEEIRKLESDKYYVYDIKEDKNFFIGDAKSVTQKKTTSWYSDSKHIIMIENDTISIIDYDGTNKRTIYSGPFDKGVLYPWPGSPELVILTNLNNPKNLSNLYVVDLR